MDICSAIYLKGQSIIVLNILKETSVYKVVLKTFFLNQWIKHAGSRGTGRARRAAPLHRKGGGATTWAIIWEESHRSFPVTWNTWLRQSKWPPRTPFTERSPLFLSFFILFYTPVDSKVSIRPSWPRPLRIARLAVESFQGPWILEQSEAVEIFETLKKLSSLSLTINKSRVNHTETTPKTQMRISQVHLGSQNCMEGVN